MNPALGQGAFGARALLWHRRAAAGVVFHCSTFCCSCCAGPSRRADWLRRRQGAGALQTTIRWSSRPGGPGAVIHPDENGVRRLIRCIAVHNNW